jgi:hypothetical protein
LSVVPAEFVRARTQSGLILDDFSNVEFHYCQADRGNDRVIRFANLCQTNS